MLQPGLNLFKGRKHLVCKMGSFTKIIIASICVIFLAVKWTAPRFDKGKRNTAKCIQTTQTCMHIKDCAHHLYAAVDPHTGC